MPSILPRYPVYIPSKGRWHWERALTARSLAHDRVPFRLVVEPQHEHHYRKLIARLDFPGITLLVLPHDNPADLGAVPVRRWIKEHSVAEGAERHWQLDDNMRGFYRQYKGKRMHCEGGIALRVCEDFTDRYENIAVSGLNYDMFAVKAYTPVVINVHVYSCTLVNNAIPHTWRGRYNDDTDLCLQVLADGWCTALLNAFVVKKQATMTLKGGMTDTMYHGDGRLKMARSLQRVWPRTVTTDRRWQRPQHVVDWKKFDTPLRLKAGIDLAALAPVDEYGLTLQQVKPVRSERLARLAREYEQR